LFLNALLWLPGDERNVPATVINADRSRPSPSNIAPDAVTGCRPYGLNG